MAKYKLIVLSQPISAEHEKDYNDWYQNVHLAQVVAVDGCVSAQRYRLAHRLNEEPILPYLAIYDVDAENVAAVMAELDRRVGTDRMIISDTLDQTNVIAGVFEEFGDRADRA